MKFAEGMRSCHASLKHPWFIGQSKETWYHIDVYTFVIVRCKYNIYVHNVIYKYKHDYIYSCYYYYHDHICHFFYLSHHILNIFTKDDLWRSYCFPLITVVAGTPGSASLYHPPIDNGSENPWRVGLPPSGIFNEHVWNLNPIIFFPFCPSTWVQIRYFCI